MKNKKCPWWKKCRNGGDGCWALEPETCVRFLPLEGTNITEVTCTVETPPNIDCDKFSQYFMNWIESMGWSFCGYFGKYEEDEDSMIKENTTDVLEFIERQLECGYINLGCYDDDKLELVKQAIEEYKINHRLFD